MFSLETADNRYGEVCHTGRSGTAILAVTPIRFDCPRCPPLFSAQRVAQSCSAFWNYSAAFIFSQHLNMLLPIYEPRSSAEMRTTPRYPLAVARTRGIMCGTLRLRRHR